MAIRSDAFVFDGASSTPLDQALRDHFPGASWAAIRKAITTGKVSVEGRVSNQTRALVSPLEEVQVRMSAPKLRPGEQPATRQILYCDAHVLVVDKPAGISSVDHEREPTSLQSQLRSWLTQHEKRTQPPLKVVHRLDKVTSGVMVFARTATAQAALKQQFKAHTTGRFYLAIAHGAVREGVLKFRLVRDRGDGLRGITRDPGRGSYSETCVRVRERFARCTFVECQLATGRTHQIRIHLSQVGNPLVGEPVYSRGYNGVILPAPRTLLHAAFLSFNHPVFRKRLEYESPLPSEFEQFLVEERRRSRETPGVSTK